MSHSCIKRMTNTKCKKGTNIFRIFIVPIGQKQIIFVFYYEIQKVLIFIYGSRLFVHNLFSFTAEIVDHVSVTSPIKVERHPLLWGRMRSWTQNSFLCPWSRNLRAPSKVTPHSDLYFFFFFTFKLYCFNILKLKATTRPQTEKEVREQKKKQTRRHSYTVEW